MEDPSKKSSSLFNFQKLQGHENYESWRFSMKMLLKYEKLWGYVDGSVASTATNYVAGDDVKAQCLIGLALSPALQHYADSAKNARDTWVAIENKYKVKGIASRCALLNNLCSLKLKNFKNMGDYVAAFVQLKHKFKEVGMSVDDEVFGGFMLNGLPESYEPVAMAIDMSTQKLDSESIASRLLAEEARRQARAGDPEQEKALAVRGPATGLAQQQGGQHYNPHRDLECGYCHKKGHIKKNCFKKRNSEQARSQNPGDHAGRASSCNKRVEGKKIVANSFIAAALGATQINNDSWYVDSGASCHMTRRKDWLDNFSSCDKISVALADGSVTTSDAQGNVKFQFSDSVKTMHGVRYVPGLSTNLASVRSMTDKNLAVLFIGDKCQVFHVDDFKHSGTVQFDATLMNNMYRVNGKPISECDSVNEGNLSCDQVYTATINVWHKRMGHLSEKGLNVLRNENTGVKFHDHLDECCVGCQEGKQCRKTFSNLQGGEVKEKLELVHSDVAGPFIESLGGSRYLLTFLDDKTRKIFCYFIKSKDEVVDKFQEFKNLVENQSGCKIKVLRSDNGREYVNKRMSEICSKAGIVHQTSVRYTPEQNGRAERINRTICEKARCMMRDAKCPKKFWAEACHTAVYLANRSPHFGIMGKIPEVEWSGHQINLEHLRVFGCRVFSHIPGVKRSKWDAKSTEGMMVGYAETSKGYRILDPNLGKIQTLRDVNFFEKEMFYDQDKMKQEIQDHDRFYYNFLEGWSGSSESGEEQVSLIEQDDSENSGEVSDLSLEETASEPEGESLSDASQPFDSSEEEGAEMGEEVRRSTRDRIPNKQMSDYVWLASGCVSGVSLPFDYEDALSGPDRHLWEKAIEEELSSIRTNGTWELVDLPPGQTPVKNKWVFKVKTESDGSLRYKARLVAKGFSQQLGVNYEETFAPVIRREALRLLFALAVQHDMSIFHLDVKTAFLNGPLSEIVYMYQPQGFIAKGQEKKVCLLKKAIYGLKQASRAWNQRIHKELESYGLTQCINEPCLYYRVQQDSMLFLALYVDDTFIFSNDMNACNALQDFLMSRFQMQNLGNIKNCLGMKVTRKEDGSISLDQKQYIHDLLDKFNMTDCKPVGTPMEVNFNCVKEIQSTGTARDLPYQQLIGSLMYLAVNTRPDIWHSVIRLSQYNTCFNEELYKHALRILRYLKGTANVSLVFKKSKNPHLSGFIDADWGGDKTDRCSYTGYIFKYGDCPISWCSRKQRCVSQSSTEAEFVALSEGGKEAVYIRSLLEQLFKNAKCHVTLFNDNQGAIELVKNAMFSHSTKHIEIKYHFIRYAYDCGKFSISYMDTNQMVADFLTKPLCKIKHDNCCKKSSLV